MRFENLNRKIITVNLDCGTLIKRSVPPNIYTGVTKT